MSSSLIESLPEIVALRARSEGVNAERAQHLAWMTEQGVRYREAVDVYREQLAEAVAKGKKPPAEPSPPDGNHHAEMVATFVARDAAIREERQRVLAAHADEIEAEARQRLADLLDEARPGVTALARIAASVARLQADVYAVRAASADLSISYDPQRGGARPEAFNPPSAGDVIAAVEHGVNLLDEGGGTARVLGFGVESDFGAGRR